MYQIQSTSLVAPERYPPSWAPTIILGGGPRAYPLVYFFFSSLLDAVLISFPLFAHHIKLSQFPHSNFHHPLARPQAPAPPPFPITTYPSHPLLSI